MNEGEQKAEQVKAKIAQVRTFIGYREYPKYGMVSRYFVYKQTLMREAQRLLKAKLLTEAEDVFYLSFHKDHAGTSLDRPAGHGQPDQRPVGQITLVVAPLIASPSEVSTRGGVIAS